MSRRREEEILEPEMADKQEDKAESRDLAAANLQVCSQNLKWPNWEEIASSGSSGK